MEGENRTAFPCMLLSTCLSDDLMGASMLTRVTYDIVDHELVVAAEQTWQVSVQPWASPLGEFSGDQPKPKGGVDLFVAGSARAPGDEPVKQLPLSFAVGELRFEAIAIGPRVWQKRIGGAVAPSDPQPFTSLPVGIDRAFGGHILWDGLKSPYPLNPNGVGFQVDPASALDQPLPFIEDPRHRVSSIEDQPRPVGFGLCQYPHPLRLLESATVDGKPMAAYRADPTRKRAEIKFLPRVFNRAFPEMIAAAVAPGSRVVVEGFSPAGTIGFVVPPPPVLAQLELGGQRSEHVPAIDELCVDADRNQVMIGFRYALTYAFVAHEERRCTLVPADGRTGLAQASHVPTPSTTLGA